MATVNLYVGADFSPVLALDPSDPDFGSKLVAGVATIYSQIGQSNFQTRAEAVARQIVTRGPDLVAPGGYVASQAKASATLSGEVVSQQRKPIWTIWRS